MRRCSSPAPETLTSLLRCCTSVPPFVVALFYFPVHVAFSDGVIVVQNVIRRFEIPVGDVAYVDVTGG